jgi:hypothetical protein
VDYKKGTLYIGDGGFGADLVSVSTETLESDWIEIAEALWHFLVVNTSYSQVHIQTIDSVGVMFDNVTIPINHPKGK